jgi:predicted regulator of Ras-like GTPase activity (Roadblock/LC7/MglB family)
MLQRTLAGLYRLEGVQHAMLIDDSGTLLASVGDEGSIPPFDHAVDVISAALDSADALGLGAVYEAWCEGENRMMIDVASPNRIVALSGNGGRLARWRHALDRDRKILATTPQ